MSVLFHVICNLFQKPHVYHFKRQQVRSGESNRIIDKRQSTNEGIFRSEHYFNYEYCQHKKHVNIIKP